MQTIELNVKNENGRNEIRTYFVEQVNEHEDELSLQLTEALDSLRARDGVNLHTANLGTDGDYSVPVNYECECGKNIPNPDSFVRESIVDETQFVHYHECSCGRIHREEMTRTALNEVFDVYE